MWKYPKICKYNKSGCDPITIKLQYNENRIGKAIVIQNNLISALQTFFLYEICLKRTLICEYVSFVKMENCVFNVCTYSLNREKNKYC